MQQSGAGQFVQSTPFTCRYIYFSLVICWVLSIFTDIPSLFYSSLSTTIFSFQIWRLVTCIWWQSSLFPIIIIIINCAGWLGKVQTKIGSTALIVKIVSTNIAIQIIAFILQLPLSLIIRTTEIGFGGIWMYLIVKYCQYNPDGMIKLCCFSTKLNKNAYPWILTLVMWILGFQIRIELLAGILLAMTQQKIGLGEKNIIGDIPLKTIDHAFNLMRLNKFQCWIPYEGVETDAQIFTNLETYVAVSSSSPGSQDNSTQNNDDPFKNKKGVRISDY